MTDEATVLDIEETISETKDSSTESKTGWFQNLILWICLFWTKLCDFGRCLRLRDCNWCSFACFEKLNITGFFTGKGRAENLTCEQDIINFLNNNRRKVTGDKSKPTEIENLPQSVKLKTKKIGLINLGNTCFMNSVLQALFMAADFRRYVLSLNLSGCQSLMEKLKDLFKKLSETNKRIAYAPCGFFMASTPPGSSPNSQEDSAEYLRFLLNSLQEEEKSTQNSTPRSTELGKEEKTVIESMFGGKLKTNTWCKTCKSTSQKREDFTDLPLAFSSFVKSAPVIACSTEEKPYDSVTINMTPAAESPTEENMSHGPSNISCQKTGEEKTQETPTVKDLLTSFLAPEVLDGDKKYQCQTCASLQTAERTKMIVEEPQYLILTLLRFAYDTICNVKSKILDPVSIPLVLDLPVERSTSRAASADQTLENENRRPEVEDLSHNQQQVPYVLNSVVVHSGLSSDSGHYYSYARDMTDNSGCSHSEKHSSALGSVNGNEEWFLFDDSSVSRKTTHFVLNRQPSLATPYILIYKKSNCGETQSV
ncbi:ubiquitin carboxyl-terminal hydrolase 38-like [Pelobates fuscus]|uniref:ubiquitin carboxyl-terminal hydrolase 38-like n=1 Tax=Pelobates fuscus TaxID=191477 RepID=UPI002FE48775